jgi:hypothetical protein
MMTKIMAERGFSTETLLDRLECFGGFTSHVEEIRKKVDFYGTASRVAGQPAGE